MWFQGFFDFEKRVIKSENIFLTSLWSQRMSGTYYEHNWSSSYDDCGTYLKNKGSWIDVAEAWYYAMIDFGHAVSWVINDTLYQWEFHDPNYDPGYDYMYIDDADIAMLLTHGGCSASSNWEYSALMSRKDYYGDCYANQLDMVYGDDATSTPKGDLEALIIPGCHGLHYCNNWKWDFDHELHSINAFHGETHTGYELVPKMEDFVSDGYDESISDAWMSIMHYTAGSYWQCPVTVTRADNSTHAQNYMFDETFYLEFGDYPPDTYGLRRKYSTCDPGLPGPTHGDTYANTTCVAKSSSPSTISPVSTLPISEIESAFYQNYNSFLIAGKYYFGTENISLNTFGGVVGIGKIDEVNFKNAGNVERQISHSTIQKMTPDEILKKYDELNSEEDSVCEETDNLYKQIIKKNHAKDRLVYIDTLHTFSGAMPDDNDLETSAWAMFDQLGLPKEEIGDVYVDHIELDSHDKNTGTVSNPVHIQTVVLFTRSANGFDFENSQFYAIYGHDGKLKKVEANWPKLEFHSGAVLKEWKDIELEIGQKTSSIKDFSFMYDAVELGGVRKFVPTIRIIENGWIDLDGTEHSGNVVRVVMTK